MATAVNLSRRSRIIFSQSAEIRTMCSGLCSDVESQSIGRWARWGRRIWGRNGSSGVAQVSPDRNSFACLRCCCCLDPSSEALELVSLTRTPPARPRQPRHHPIRWPAQGTRRRAALSDRGEISSPHGSGLCSGVITSGCTADGSEERQYRRRKAL